MDVDQKDSFHLTRTKIVLNNLENQHDWVMLDTHTGPSQYRRPLISGLPPRRLYVHPDEQIEIIAAEKATKQRIAQPRETEWVLPLDVKEEPSLADFAAVFDAISAMPSERDGQRIGDASASYNDHTPSKAPEDERYWQAWRGAKRGKRVLLAIVQDDSTVVYYLMHEGIVKPRQN